MIEWAQGRPVTIRTLDAGGDKPIKGLTIDGESNPFLGVRGVRLSLARPEIFRVQLRALLRAAVHGPLKVMVPMVTVPAELDAVRMLMGNAYHDLKREGFTVAVPALGMMIEVPAAALALSHFNADFYSIGSNDLIQYTMAAGRDIGAVAALADARHPAFLRLIEIVAAYGAQNNIEVSLCGDAGGDPALIPYLLQAGIRTLSVAPGLVGAAKLAISETNIAEKGR
jgi:phosphotransferase system enzyme I (PtsI)